MTQTTSIAPAPSLDLDRASGLAHRYLETRSFTESICEGLLPEDYVLQSMPEASPPKWHLAHTTWFFETFVLRPHLEGFQPFHPSYHFLFNSYYKSQGPHFERARRGMLSRPGVEEIQRYRKHVDRCVLELLDRSCPETLAAIEMLLELGLQHEQQHQELLLTDIKHHFWVNPLRPAFRPATLRPASEPQPARVLGFPEGVVQIGAAASGTGESFAFDIEMPRHRVFLEAYGLHSRPVSCGEYLEFIEAGGYREPSYWLSDGWDKALAARWEAPLYWEKGPGGEWQVFTLRGMQALDENEPVCHVSYYEADAFARWRGLRLPTEAEWENAASSARESPAERADACFAESGRFHPRPGGPLFLGNVWEWTASPYVTYPGFKPLPSSLGEYNGKFACNQFVLRGGSCVTPSRHIRPSYRNFFPPEARWQFSGLRLAT